MKRKPSRWPGWGSAPSWRSTCRSRPPLDLFGLSLNTYEGICAIVVNLVIAVVATIVLRAVGAGDHADETRREDYEERAEVHEEPLPASVEQEARCRREVEPTRRP